MIATTLDNIPNAHLMVRLVLLSLAISTVGAVLAPLLFGKLTRFRSLAYSLAVAALVLVPPLALSSHVSGIDWTRVAPVKVVESSKSSPVLAANGELVATAAADGPAITMLWSPGPLVPTSLISGGRAVWINLLGLIWLAGFGVMLARLALGAWRVARVLRSTRAPNAAERRKLSLGAESRDSTVALRISPLPVVPFFSGFARRRIVIPEKLVSELSAAELEMVIEHERAHCHQQDQWVALLQQLARAIHWWNPLAAVVNRRLSQTREELCDYAVTRAKSAEFVESYSRLLVAITDTFSREPSPACALAVTSTYRSIRRRILMLKQGGAGNHRQPPRVLVSAVFLLTGLLLIPVSCKSGDGWNEEGQIPGKKTLNAELSELMSGWQKVGPFSPPAELNAEESAARILVRARFVQTFDEIEDGLPAAALLTDPQSEVLIRTLSRRDGIDLLSLPVVLVKNGQQGRVDVAYDTPVPGPEGGKEETVNVGVVFDVTPTYGGGRIHLVGKAIVRQKNDQGSSTEATSGDAKPAAGGAVSFNTAESYFSASMESGATLLLNSRRDSGQKKGRLMIAITARVVE